MAKALASLRLRLHAAMQLNPELVLTAAQAKDGLDAQQLSIHTLDGHKLPSGGADKSQVKITLEKMTQTTHHGSQGLPATVEAVGEDGYRLLGESPRSQRVAACMAHAHAHAPAPARAHVLLGAREPLKTAT